MTTTNGRPASRRTFTRKTDAERDAELDVAREILARGVEKIRSSEDWKEYLRMASKFHTYSFNNIMLCMLQLSARGMEPPTRLASFNTWKKLGRSVSAGQKGLLIFAPIIVKVKPGEDGYDPSREKTKLVGFRITRTFDLQQTYGKELPARSVVEYPKGEIPAGMWESAVRFAESIGFSVSIGDAGPAEGYTVHGTKKIVISEKLGDAAREAVTLFHEIAHAMLHAPEDFDYDANRGLAETEAESVAFIIGTYFGIDTGSQSFDYVAGWQPTPDAVSKVGTRVMNVVRKIIDAVEPDIVTPDVPEAPTTAPVPPRGGSSHG